MSKLSSSSFVSMELGRKVLAGFLDKEKTVIPVKVHKSIVDVLRAQPKLALEDFGGQPPLCWMIQFQAELEYFQAVYQVCPNVLKFKFGPNQELPLHLACRSPSSSEDVLEYIIQEYPKGLQVTNASNLLPIHVAFQERPEDQVSLRLVQSLLRHYPESLAIRAQHLNWEWMSPLEWAVYRHYPIPILEFMISVVPTNMTDFWLRSEEGISLEEIQTVTPCFHQLTKLRCHVASWEEEQPLISLMEALETCHETLKDLDMFVPVVTLISSRDSLVLLSGLFENGAALEHVHFKALGRERQEGLFIDSRILKMITNGLDSRSGISPLQSLSLEDFVFVDREILTSFLISAAAPSRVSFTTSVLEGYLDAASLDWSSCPIQHFECENCVVFLSHATVCLDFLHRIAKMANLRELVLWLRVFCRDPNGEFLSRQQTVTDQVIYILNQCPLQKLLIQGSDVLVETEPVCEAIRYNTSLKELFIESALDTELKQEVFEATLALYNTTLQSTCGRLPETSTKSAGKIRYWMLLNQYGRAQLRNEQTASLATVIRLLSVVSEDDNDVLKRHEYAGELSVFFGLLYECPNLWCLA